MGKETFYGDGLNRMESFHPFVYPFCEGKKRFLFIDLHKGDWKQPNTLAVCLDGTCCSDVLTSLGKEFAHMLCTN